MSSTRLMIVVATGLSLLLCLGGTASADGDAPADAEHAKMKSRERQQSLERRYFEQQLLGITRTLEAERAKFKAENTKLKAENAKLQAEKAKKEAREGSLLGAGTSRLGPPPTRTVGASPTSRSASAGGMFGGTTGRDFNRPGRRSARGPDDALRKKDPEMYRLLAQDKVLDVRAKEMAAVYRQAPIPEREKIKKQLGQFLAEHFEVRQQRRGLELKRLEEKLARLRDAIELRNKAQELLIGKRMTELLGEQEPLDF